MLFCTVYSISSYMYDKTVTEVLEPQLKISHVFSHGIINRFLKMSTHAHSHYVFIYICFWRNKYKNSKK